MTALDVYISVLVVINETYFIKYVWSLFVYNKKQSTIYEAWIKCVVNTQYEGKQLNLETHEQWKLEIHMTEFDA